MEKETNYPSYDVMREQEHWDEHTRSIVAGRLVRRWDFRFLSLEEAEMLHVICSRLIDDNREDLIAYIVQHIDEFLYTSPGEGQRKVGVPQAQQLIREGLRAINESSKKEYLLSFIQLEERQHWSFLDSLSRGTAAEVPEWSKVPQVELFKKLLDWTTEAYYSHPTVWSEIGYGGPAYPRGYVRVQMGQLDPWEAQPKES